MEFTENPPVKISPFTMEDQLLQYFQGEKAESLLFLLIAGAAILVSVYVLANQSEYRLVAIPLLAIALLQVVVGGTVFLRTPKQVMRLSVQLDDEPAVYRAAEQKRMEVVRRNFRIYKVAEIVVLAAGIVLTYWSRDNLGLYSVGIGMIAQGAAMLLCDLFAERRAVAYLEVLRNFQ
jgi:hypothetical protein